MKLKDLIDLLSSEFEKRGNVEIYLDSLSNIPFQKDMEVLPIDEYNISKEEMKKRRYQKDALILHDLISWCF